MSRVPREAAINLRNGVENEKEQKGQLSLDHVSVPLKITSNKITHYQTHSGGKNQTAKGWGNKQ